MINQTDITSTILQTAIEISKEEGAFHIANLLRNSELTLEETGYSNYNGGIYYYTFFITVDVKTYVSIKSKLSEIEEELLGRFLETIKQDDGNEYTRVSIIPKANFYLTENNPHRPLSPIELERKEQLNDYITKLSEDNLIEEVLLPLFRHLGFRRITAARHKDKIMEYGKDIWMKYILPTQNVLYFGIQVKKNKLDASGVSKTGSANVAEILNQVTMMLGHEIFDAETNRRVLVDHAFIVAGGEITKQARNWLAGKLDSSKRSQIMFIEKDDILNLYVVNNIPLPAGALPSAPNPDDDSLPF